MSHVESSSGDSRLAGAFLRLGWIGFWLQIAIGSIPLALLIYALVFGRNDGIGTRGRFTLLEYLTVGSLLVLAFTTFWFYRYTRLGNRIAEPHTRPSTYSIQRTACVV